MNSKDRNAAIARLDGKALGVMVNVGSLSNFRITARMSEEK